MSCKKQYNPVPTIPRAGRSLLRDDSALSARNCDVAWPWFIGLGKNLFPADGHLAGVTCAGFRKTSAGGPPRNSITSGDQTKETHTAHGTVPGPASSVQRGRLPISRTAVARASRRECQSRGPAQQHNDANVAQAKNHVRL